MHVWRLTLAQHRVQAIRGIGARRFGGRWNPIGTPMVYASCSLELAVLEIVVQAHPDELGKTEYCWIEYEVPDDAVGMLEALPVQWDDPPPHRPSVQSVGGAWAASHRSLALSVPAAVLPERRSILINPAHSRCAEIREIASAPFTWPKRLTRYLDSLRAGT